MKKLIIIFGLILLFLLIPIAHCNAQRVGNGVVFPNFNNIILNSLSFDNSTLIEFGNAYQTEYYKTMEIGVSSGSIPESYLNYQTKNVSGFYLYKYQPIYIDYITVYQDGIAIDYTHAYQEGKPPIYLDTNDSFNSIFTSYNTADLKMNVYLPYEFDIERSNVDNNLYIETLIAIANSSIIENPTGYASYLAQEAVIGDINTIMIDQWTSLPEERLSKLDILPENIRNNFKTNNFSYFSSNYTNGGISNFENYLNQINQSIIDEPFYKDASFWYSFITSIIFILMSFIFILIGRFKEWLNKQGIKNGVAIINYLLDGFFAAIGIILFTICSPNPLTPFQWIVALCSIIAGVFISIICEYFLIRKNKNPNRYKRRRQQKAK